LNGIVHLCSDFLEKEHIKPQRQQLFQDALHSEGRRRSVFIQTINVQRNKADYITKNLVVGDTRRVFRGRGLCFEVRIRKRRGIAHDIDTVTSLALHARVGLGSCV